MANFPGFDSPLQATADVELFDLLFEESPTAILTTDTAGRIEGVNRAAIQLLARGRAELHGTPLLEHVLAGDRAQLRARLGPCLEGRIVDCTARVTRGDGGSRVVRVHAVPVVLDEGVARLEVFLEDVTGSPFRATDDPVLYRLLEQLPGQFTLVLDPNGRIRRAAGLAGTHWLNDGDCIGRSYTLLLAPDDGNRRMLDVLTDASAADTGWSGTLWHVRADGARLPVRIFAFPYRDPRTQERRGTVVIGRDTSVEHELEQRLHRQERLAVVGELVASIAGELSRALKAAASAPVALASAEVARLERVLDSLTAFTSTYLAGTDSRCDVQREVEAALAEVAPGALCRMTHEPADRLPQIAADADHVRLAVRELVHNALEAAGAHGHVRVVTLEHAGGVRLRVQDDGPGVQGAELEWNCEPFVTTKRGRLGLGLAIVRGIAALYGGRMQLLPAAGGGTTAELDLPAGRADASVFRPMPLLLARGRTVLVVDDDVSVRTLLRTVLERVGYRVQEAWSGRSALAVVADAGVPDIVLTDMKMGGGSGMWLLTQLRRYEPRLLERTIIITGYTDDEQLAELARAAACPVVRKPLDFRLLIELMNDVLLRSTR